MPLPVNLNNRASSPRSSALGSSGKASTSIGKVGANRNPQSSVFSDQRSAAASSVFQKNAQGAQSSVFSQRRALRSLTAANAGEDAAYEQAREENRYRYVRQLIKERQAQERAKAEKRAKQLGVSVDAVLDKDGKMKKAGQISRSASGGGDRTTKKVKDVKTGGRFSKKAFTKAVRRMIYRKPAAYKNISAQDRKYFVDLVGKYAGKLGAGQGFSRPIRRRMRLDVEHSRRAGDISYEDAQDFKRLIDEMK